MSTTKETNRLSRFTHFIDLSDGYTAIYHSVNMGIVFAKTEYIEEFRKSGWLACAGSTLGNLVEELKKERMLIVQEVEEMSDYNSIQASLPELPITILYLLLTDLCNFACRYCFIEGNFPADFCPASMTPEIAQEGIDLFAKTLAKNPRKHFHPRVIFYGGEPLLNFPTLKFALEYIEQLKKEGVLPESVKITVNTNASAVNSEITETLASYRVSVAVSLDGRKEIHDLERVSHSGLGTFDTTVQGLRLLQTAGVQTSISCTITEAGAKVLEESLRFFVSEFGIKSVGFNIIREGTSPKIRDINAYTTTVSNALVSCFRLARKEGIYEDRMMRKARAFARRQPHLNDCAGCGQQIVIAPTGEVGICHADVGKKTYFVSNTPDFDPLIHPCWQEWRKRSPFSMKECLNCIAIGICGGGCPYHVYLKKGTIWALDDAFCIHSKTSLEFLIKDLWEQTRTKTEPVT